MADKAVWAHGTHSNKSDQDIDQWRAQKRDDWDNAGIGGALIVHEGKDWIILEGEQNAVDNEVHQLEGDSFLDSFDKLADRSMQNPNDNALTYHLDRDPITNVD